MIHDKWNIKLYLTKLTSSSNTTTKMWWVLSKWVERNGEVNIYYRSPCFHNLTKWIQVGWWVSGKHGNATLPTLSLENQILTVYYSLLSSLNSYELVQRQRGCRWWLVLEIETLYEIQQPVIGCRRIHNVAYWTWIPAQSKRWRPVAA